VRSPIKNLKNQTNSFSAITQLAPKGSVIDYYPLYSGNLPIKLSEVDRFVIAHTPNYVVYEFWKCVMQEPERISKIAESFYPSLNESTFDILKKNWYSYKDPFVRSALFFLLNRCSNLGMITHGELDTKNYNAFALRDLRSLKVENMHVNLLKDSRVEELGENIAVINAGKYRVSFLENEQILGEEETEIKHQQLLKKMSINKSIIIFKSHRALLKNKAYDKIMLDQHGRATTDFAQATEIILHNVR
jgi:hypothetical protein